jgi:predicted nucleic acid-binding protein
MRRVVADTGIFFFFFYRRDSEHRLAAAFFNSFRGELIIPDVAITEICYLLSTKVNPQAEIDFIKSVANLEFTIEHLTYVDWLRIHELTAKYISFPLGVVDAAVVAIAERLRIQDVATLNDRHFRTVRPNHVGAFRLLPYDL